MVLEALSAGPARAWEEGTVAAETGAGELSLRLSRGCTSEACSGKTSGRMSTAHGEEHHYGHAILPQPPEHDENQKLKAY